MEAEIEARKHPSAHHPLFEACHGVAGETDNA
jgi:hypothetical protein